MVVFPRTTQGQSKVKQQRTDLLIDCAKRTNRLSWQHCTIHRSARATLVALFLVCFVTSSTIAQSCPLYTSPHQRIGFNVAPDGGIDINRYDAAPLGAGWYHNYGRRINPFHPDGIQYHQMVRSDIDRTDLPALLGPAIAKNQGALWILGNEPDHHGQDGLTPSEYADFYHDLYTYIRTTDPTARIAIAGIVQPTPIRLRYLESVLAIYESRYGVPMPVEIWDIHNFILPENCAWGAGIPPTLEAYREEGTPCPDTLDDHGDLDIFKAQIRTFRQWMAAHGYRNTPLIITEYGILLSKYHGYDYARVRDFMLGSFNFMLHETDSTIGYPADGNRLVQEFAWFSLNYWEYNLETRFGLNGNLLDHDSGAITPLGHDFAAYTQAVTVETIDLAITAFNTAPTAPSANTPIQLETQFVNKGGIAAQNVTVQFWNGNPNNGGLLLGTAPAHAQVRTGCYEIISSEFEWTPPYGGLFTLFTVIEAENDAFEVDPTNNSASRAVIVEGSTPTPTSTPAPTQTPTLSPTPSPTPGAGTPTPTFQPTASTTATSIVSTTPTATYTPTATPSPTPSPTQASNGSNSFVIDPNRTSRFTWVDGDTVEHTIIFPVGAVDQITELRFQAWNGLERTQNYMGRALQITAYRDGIELTSFTILKPIVLTMHYLDTDLEQLDEQSIALDSLAANGTWSEQGVTMIQHDIENNLISVSYNDTSRDPSADRVFALFADEIMEITPTPTPTVTPTATTSPITSYTEHIFLPSVHGGP